MPGRRRAEVPPIPSFKVNGGSSTNTVDFDASGSIGAAQYVWQFNDDINPADTPQQNTVTTDRPVISHTFPDRRHYTVALTVMAADGTSRGASQDVAAGAPNAAFGSSTNSAIEGAPVSFSSSSADFNPGGSISSWSWNFGDGSGGSGPNVSHAFHTGVYNVTLTVTNTLGIASQISHGVGV